MPIGDLLAGRNKPTAIGEECDFRLLSVPTPCTGEDTALLLVAVVEEKETLWLAAAPAFAPPATDVVVVVVSAPVVIFIVVDVRCRFAFVDLAV